MHYMVQQHSQMSLGTMQAVFVNLAAAVSSQMLCLCRVNSSPGIEAEGRHYRAFPADFGQEVQPGQDDLQKVST